MASDKSYAQMVKSPPRNVPPARTAPSQAMTAPVEARPLDARPVDTRALYTVIVRGERFVLSDEMLDYDAPSYFTSAFRGQFAEASNRFIDLGQAHDPALFRLIFNHLCGYDVLPLTERQCPATMSIEATLRNLLKFAEFLSLESLESLLKAKVSPPPAHVRLVPSVTAIEHPHYPLGDRDLHEEREHEGEDSAAPFVLRLSNFEMRLRPPGAAHNVLDEDRSYLDFECGWNRKQALKGVEDLCGRTLRWPEGLGIPFDSTRTAVVLEDRGRSPTEPRAVHCNASDIWAILYYQSSTNHDDRYVSTRHRKGLIDFFDLPEDEDKYIELDEEHERTGDESVHDLVMFDLTCIARPATQPKNKAAVLKIDSKDVLTIKLVTHARFNEILTSN